MIINKNGTDYQERNDVFSDKYILVPKEFEEIVRNNLGYLKLEIENDVLINVIINEDLKLYDEETKEIEKEISTLKQQLSDTDYQAIKYAEGILTEYEYAEMKSLRQQWRDRINELESELM